MTLPYVIASSEVWEVGDRVTIHEYEDGGNSCRALIVREATEQEYIDSCLADPNLPPDSKPLLIITNDPTRRWYEVSMD